VQKIPLVTVAMPVYNAGKHLRMAVLSIVGQTFTDWNLLIIDDGSTDDAFERIKDIQDERIEIIRDGLNKGLAKRLNESIDLAKGKYFARMDQDDISYPERFKKQIEYLEAHSDIDLVALRAVTISDNGGLVGYLPYAETHSLICAKPWSGFYMPHPTWMGKLSWFRHYYYSNDAPYFCEDQELLLRSYRTSLFYNIPEILFAYRVRKEINLKKILNIRKTVLFFQVKYCVSRCDLHYIFLVLLSFIAKAFKDIFDSLNRKDYSPHKKCVVSNRDADEYQIVIKDLCF